MNTHDRETPIEMHSKRQLRPWKEASLLWRLRQGAQRQRVFCKH